MLRRKLYFVIALVALLVAGFLGTSVLSYLVASDSLARQISEQTLPLTSDNVYSEIQRDLLRPVLISSLMANDTFLRDWVMEGEPDPLRMQSYLETIQDRYGTITAFFVSESSRHYYHHSGILKQVHEDDPADAWYFRSRALRDAYEINVDQDTADPRRLSIFVNFRVLDPLGALLGVTGVGLSMEAVSALIDNYQARYGRSIHFVDRLGNIVLSGSEPGAKTYARLQDRPGLASLSSKLLSSPSSNFSYPNADGDEIYLNSRLVPEFDWYLVVEQQGNLAAGRMKSALWVSIGLSVGILALVLFAAHFTLQAYQRQLEEMATTDRLTGAANRHVFEALFNQMARAAQRAGRPLSLLSIDIDRFKQVNDTFGHPGGDLVLRTVADCLRAQLRDSDTLCRWGGEEFLLLLDNCSLDLARQRAESLREAVAHLAIPFGREAIRVTISCGVAEHQRGEPLDFLVSRVDALLYGAKQRGRDQVCVAV